MARSRRTKRAPRVWPLSDRLRIREEMERQWEREHAPSEEERMRGNERRLAEMRARRLLATHHARSR